MDIALPTTSILAMAHLFKLDIYILYNKCYFYVLNYILCSQKDCSFWNSVYLE